MRPVVPLTERHLQTIPAEHVERNHPERTHQRLGNELLKLLPAAARGGGSIHFRERLGGILKW